MNGAARLPFHRRVAALARTPLYRQALLVEASVDLLVSRVLLKTVPFPKLAQRWGAFVPPSDPRAGSGLLRTSDEPAVIAGRVGDAVRRAARNVPFGAVCLPQAMAARRMLARRGVPSVMHFGAAKGQDKPIDAHAWLDAAGVKVTGYPVANGFVEIGCFVGSLPPVEGAGLPVDKLSRKLVVSLAMRAAGTARGSGSIGPCPSNWSAPQWRYRCSPPGPRTPRR